MDAQSIRELAYQAPQIKIPIGTPFWPGTDGTISIGDISIDEFETINKLTGTSDYGATLICYTLVSSETGQRIFGKINDKSEFVPTDRDWIKGQLTIVTELVPKIHAFFGVGKSRQQQIDEKKASS
jgi:hypothetical protein